MEHDLPDWLHLLFGACALLFIGLSLPLLRRKVRPNPYYGFRVPATLKDERLWYEVNAKTGLDMLVVGTGLLGITLAHLLGWISAFPYALLAAVWLGAGGLFMTLHGFVVIVRRGA